GSDARLDALLAAGSAGPARATSPTGPRHTMSDQWVPALRSLRSLGRDDAFRDVFRQSPTTLKTGLRPSRCHPGSRSAAQAIRDPLSSTAGSRVRAAAREPSA